jgi:prevent-host-death family protein
MKEVAISEFRARCFALLRQVQKTKKAIRIPRRGSPVAEVVLASPPFRSDWMGSMKDHIEIVDDILLRCRDPVLNEVRCDGA